VSLLLLLELVLHVLVLLVLVLLVQATAQAALQCVLLLLGLIPARQVAAHQL
jgi:hypothetical protein